MKAWLVRAEVQVQAPTRQQALDAGLRQIEDRAALRDVKIVELGEVASGGLPASFHEDQHPGG